MNDLFWDFNKISKVSELLEMQVIDNNEEMLYLPDVIGDKVIFRTPCYLKNISNHNENNIFFYARESIAKKIKNIANELKTINSDAKLVIFNCYRPLKIQRENFKITLEDICKKYPNIAHNDAIEKAHIKIAMPEVAGHTTGGAVDLSIEINELPLDMGMEIGDFSQEEKLATASTHISKQQFKNRIMLRKLMHEQEFAPFNGEWWHFSYGDREWATLYKKSNAIYDNIDLSF
ncbi:MAG: M15 family metallopeptidase [Bdellovibrionota bacterium]